MDLLTATQTRSRQARRTADSWCETGGSMLDASPSPDAVQQGSSRAAPTLGRLLLALLVALAISISAAACRDTGTARDELAATAPDPIEAELDVAVTRAAAEGRPVFVHFTAEWCQPCKQLKTDVYPTPEVASRLARFVRAEIDIESETGKLSAMRYRVQTVPVLIVITPAGEELRSLRIVGARTPAQLVTTLDKALAQSGL